MTDEKKEGGAREVDKDEFDKLIKGSKPIFVDFYATWCGPCQMMLPIIDEVANEVENDATIVKIDIDKSPELAAKFNVMSVPTFIVFLSGKEHKRMIGAQTKEAIMESIKTT